MTKNALAIIISIVFILFMWRAVHHFIAGMSIGDFPMAIVNGVEDIAYRWLVVAFEWVAANIGRLPGMALDFIRN